MNLNSKTFRECISENENDLIIYSADNFAQFPRRNSSVSSKSDRPLAAASSNDLVVLRSTLDYEYHNWLRSLGLGSDFIVEYGAAAEGLSLSELILNNPVPIIETIQKTGRNPVYVPWFSGILENEAAKIIGAELFGAPESETLKYNDKASFKNICQQLDIPVVAGVSFEMYPQDSDNFYRMKTIVDNILKTNHIVIIRGALSESGLSLYKTKGEDIAEIYQIIADSGEQVVLIEPFLNVSHSPNDQWVISRDGSINHLRIRDQICKEGMIHTGTLSKSNISIDKIEYITSTSFKIVSEMAKTGYIGVIGIDYIVSDKGIFPIENNARFNGSSYGSLIVNNIEKLSGTVPIWKFMKLKITPCSFNEFNEKLKAYIYDGIKVNSIFPYNSEALSETGAISIIFLAENTESISVLERALKEVEIGREFVF